MKTPDMPSDYEEVSDDTVEAEEDELALTEEEKAWVDALADDGDDDDDEDDEEEEEEEDEDDSAFDAFVAEIHKRADRNTGELWKFTYQDGEWFGLDLAVIFEGNLCSAVLDLDQYIRDNGRCTCKGYGREKKCKCSRYDSDPLQFLRHRYIDVVETVSDRDRKRLPIAKLASKIVDNFVASFLEEEPYFKAEKLQMYNSGKRVKSAAKV